FAFSSAAAQSSSSSSPPPPPCGRSAVPPRAVSPMPSGLPSPLLQYAPRPESKIAAMRVLFPLMPLAGAALLSPLASPTPAPRPATYMEDTDFLEKHGKLYVLTTSSGGKVAASAQYQGRVMTSAVDLGGRSLGWINRAFIESGRSGTAFDNYGGE